MRCVTNEPLIYDETLLEADRYTFSVLSRILRGPCKKTITDDKDFILCLSAEGYPVWVWTADGLSEERLEEVRRLTLEEWPPDRYHYNIKYEAAEYFLSHTEGLALTMNMMTYECLAPIKPAEQAAGGARVCESSDLDLLVDWMMLFQEETGIDKRSAEEHRQGLQEKIGLKALYFWTDAEGTPVCLCGFRPNAGGLSSIGPVFTPSAERRRHYADNLVYTVTCEMIRRGLTPILYTNADYPASNGCYQKVGFRLKGTLCTIGG